MSTDCQPMEIDSKEDFQPLFVVRFLSPDQLREKYSPNPKKKARTFSSAMNRPLKDEESPKRRRIY